MNAPCLTFTSVVRRYGPVLAVNDISVSIGGGITGLVGPNAAGKTTFITLAVGLKRPTGGQIRVLGGDPWSDLGVKGQVGYCPDGERLWDNLTGLQFVVTMAMLSGVQKDQAHGRANEILVQLGMGDAMERSLATYSRGMRQKVKVAQAVVHGPRFLMLDEPLNGTDPVSRHEIMKYLRQLADQGTAIVVSSHVLHELDGFVDSVLLLHRGRLLASGTVEEIRDLIYEHPHTVRIETPDVKGLARWAVDLPGVMAVEMEDDALNVRTRAPVELYRTLPAFVMGSGVRVQSLYSTDSSLEAVFKYLTKGDLR